MRKKKPHKHKHSLVTLGPYVWCMECGRVGKKQGFGFGILWNPRQTRSPIIGTFVELQGVEGVCVDVKEDGALVVVGYELGDIPEGEMNGKMGRDLLKVTGWEKVE